MADQTHLCSTAAVYYIPTITKRLVPLGPVYWPCKQKCSNRTGFIDRSVSVVGIGTDTRKVSSISGNSNVLWISNTIGQWFATEQNQRKKFKLQKNHRVTQVYWRSLGIIPPSRVGLPYSLLNLYDFGATLILELNNQVLFGIVTYIDTAF